jgi:hypothetical protein
MPGSEQQRPLEQQPRGYYLAARFKEDALSKKVYTKTQDIIYKSDSEISAYRFLRPNQVGNEPPWYVVVIGERPTDPLHQKIKEVLQPGEQTQIPEEVYTQLYQRRIQEAQKGDWVEHHRPTPTIRRSEKKEKQKQQKQSRRRNRGR